MDIRKKISGFFTVTFTSFTVITIIYAALWSENGISSRTVFGLFGVCAVIGVLISITDYIPAQSLIARLAIDFLDTILTVYLFGGCVLKLFRFNLPMVLIVFGMMFAAYVGVFVAVMVNEKICSDEINHKLAEMKKNRLSGSIE